MRKEALPMLLSAFGAVVVLFVAPVHSGAG
jgi:hypothetical protein